MGKKKKVIEIYVRTANGKLVKVIQPLTESIPNQLALAS